MRPFKVLIQHRSIDTGAVVTTEVEVEAEGPMTAYSKAEREVRTRLLVEAADVGFSNYRCVPLDGAVA